MPENDVKEIRLTTKAFAAEYPELSGGFYEMLGDGAVGELVRFFGLGPNVERVLSELGCKVGADLLQLSENSWCLLCGERAGRKILLLRRYLKLRQLQKQGGTTSLDLAAEFSGVNKMSDEIKTSVAEIIQKIHSGNVPDEVAGLYRQMGPRNFAFWLHGFMCALSKNSDVRKSKWHKFLRKQITV